MLKAPIPLNESKRIVALRALDILDSPAEERFDRLTRIAQHIMEVPIVLISLVDSERQWFKSRQGLDASQTPRDISFCGHAIIGTEVFVVPDTLADSRFADNPLVTAAPDIRFYAGAPLTLSDGYNVGTLCAIDREPRQMSEARLAVLRDLAKCASEELERERQRRLALVAATNQARYMAIVDSSDDAIVSKTLDGIVTSWNPAAERMFGYTAQEMLGKPMALLIPPSLSSEERQILERLRKGERIEHFETTRQRKSGEIFPVSVTISPINDAAGTIIGASKIVRDITGSKLAEEALHNSASRLQLAMTAARTSLWDANAATGRVTLCARWAELIGNLPEETEMSFEELAVLTPPEERAAVMEKMLAALKGEKPDYLAEHRVRHRNGYWIWIESRGRVVERGKDGIALRMIGTNTDITERRGVEQMKAEFVSMVSHELRTPLTSVNGALGLVCGGAVNPASDQAKTMLEVAYKNSQRLIVLINDLLDMEKLSAGKMQFDMQEQALMPIIEQSLESNRAYAEKHGVKLLLQERTDDVKVTVDAGRLQQVMSNFLSNAAKFSPEGGQVEVLMKRQGQFVRVEVIDHGPGISEEFRGRIFQKFSQADSSDTRQKGGTGLGLAITKELIERMNGRIGFDSTPGLGSCFYFELPMVLEIHR
ncbi:MAG: PAS domain S-box protein [Sterolibacterium sp.]